MNLLKYIKNALRHHGLVLGILETPLLVFGLLVSSSPFIRDEAQFIQAAIAIAETGKPLFYKGEIIGLQWGLWHPPTYVYYLSFWSEIAGSSELIYRGATLVFPLLTAITIYFFTLYLQNKHLEEHLDSSWKKYPRAFPALATGIYTISPFVIQNGTLIDIDGSILAFSTTLSVFFMILSMDRYGPQNLKTYLSIAFPVAALSAVKFGVLPAVGISIFVYTLIRYDFRHSLYASISFFSGFFVFLIGWMALSHMIGLPFEEPFRQNLGMVFEKSSSSTVPLLDIILIRTWYVFKEAIWISPYLLMIAGFSLYEIKQRRESLILSSLLIPLVAVTFLQYPALGKLPYGFPKYIGVATPFLAILAASVVSRHLKLEDLARNRGEILLLIIVSAAITTVLPSPFLSPSKLDATAYITYGFSITATTFILLGAALLYTKSIIDISNSKKQILISLLAIFVGVSFGINIVHTTTNHSTRYYYGLQGTQETVNYVEPLYNELEDQQRKRILTPVDIGFYLNGPYTALRSYKESETSSPRIIVYRKRANGLKTILEDVKSKSRYSREIVGSYVILQEKERNSKQS